MLAGVGGLLCGKEDPFKTDFGFGGIFSKFRNEWQQTLSFNLPLHFVKKMISNIFLTICLTFFSVGKKCASPLYFISLHDDNEN
jgi:hypothetical protein